MLNNLRLRQSIGIDITALHDDPQLFATLKECARRPDLYINREDFPLF